MYCKKCGKFVGTAVEICDECKQKEVPANDNTQFQFSEPYQNTTYYQAPNVSQDTSAINLGKAITGMILAAVGLTFIYAGMILSWIPAAAVVFMILGLVPTILGFVFGLQSIINFKKTSHIRSGKRIPVLILGIAAVVNAAIGLICVFLLIYFVAVIGKEITDAIMDIM